MVKPEEKIKEFLSDYNPGVNVIKLKDLLLLRQNFSTGEQITSLFPPIEIGSITLVDQIVLLALKDICSPSRILEIGTYLGYSTSLFAMNTSAQIVTIDLPTEGDLSKEWQYTQNSILVDGDQNDNYLRSKQKEDGLKYISNLTGQQKKQIKFVKADSTKMSFCRELGKFNMVFIDGGHEYSIVKSDTLNALEAVEKGVIIWHDFGSKLHTGVNKLLGEKTTEKIFYVSGSLCAFSLIGYSL